MASKGGARVAEGRLLEPCAAPVDIGRGNDVRVQELDGLLGRVSVLRCRGEPTRRRGGRYKVLVLSSVKKAARTRASSALRESTAWPTRLRTPSESVFFLKASLVS